MSLRPFFAPFALGFLLLVGCGGSGSEAQGGADGRPTRANGAPGDRPAQPPVPVAVTPAVVGAIASTYSATATLEAEAEAEVLARVAGVVDRLLREEGDRVSAGDPLLEIDNDEYRLRLEQAQARTANLRSRHARLADMVERRLVSDEEFETVQSELASAEADEGLARLALGYTTVRSPFTGRVVQRLVDAGQNVSVGTPLYRVADLDPLLAVVHVPSKEFRRLKTDQAVELVLDSNRQRTSGRIKLVSPVIDPASGTIKVTLEIPTYPPDTRPGDFAEVRIVTERRENRTLVPRVSLVTDKGDEVVFVEVEGRAERRVVELGFGDDQHFEILSGVQPGDRVIVKGQRSLRHGQPVRVLEGDVAAGAR